MKNNFFKPQLLLLMLACMAMITFGCDEEEGQVKLFEPPVFGAFSTSTDISFGESITFTDTSTRVYERQWSFPGGNPASSTDSVVTVFYPSGGEYVALLRVKHIDNQVHEKEFIIHVEGPTVKTFGLFSESSNVTHGDNLLFEVNNAFNIGTTTEEKFEGEKSIKFEFVAQDTWGVMGTLKPVSGALDLSEYAEGFYKVAIKTTCDQLMYLRLYSNNGVEERAILELDPVAESYGLKRDGNWYQLSIPMQDFVAANNNLDLSSITHLMVLRSGTEEVTSDEDWDWYVDNFYLETEIEAE